MKKAVVAAIPFSIILSCGTQGDMQEPIQDNSTSITLEIVDSIGIEMGDSAYVFGAIEDAAILQDGSIMVLDGTYCNLRTYSAQGELISTTGRRGEGPGELGHPMNIYNWGDGTVGIMDFYKGGLNRFSLDGEWLGLDVEVTRNPHVDPVIMSDSEFVCFKSSFDLSDEAVNVTALIAHFQLSVEPDVTYWEKTVLWDPAKLGNLTLELFFYNFYTADRATGRVYVAPFDSDNYTIYCYNADGSLFSTITREHTPIPKTPEKIQEEIDFIAFTLSSGEGGNPDFNYECNPWPNHLPITGLFIASDGNLWARRGGTPVPTFDIWDENLELAGTATISGIEGDGSNVTLVFGPEFIVAWDENPEDYQKLYILDSEVQ